MVCPTWRTWFCSLSNSVNFISLLTSLCMSCFMNIISLITSSCCLVFSVCALNCSGAVCLVSSALMLKCQVSIFASVLNVQKQCCSVYLWVPLFMLLFIFEWFCCVLPTFLQVCVIYCIIPLISDIIFHASESVSLIMNFLYIFIYMYYLMSWFFLYVLCDGLLHIRVSCKKPRERVVLLLSLWRVPFRNLNPGFFYFLMVQDPLFMLLHS